MFTLEFATVIVEKEVCFLVFELDKFGSALFFKNKNDYLLCYQSFKVVYSISQMFNSYFPLLILSEHRISFDQHITYTYNLKINFFYFYGFSMIYVLGSCNLFQVDKQEFL